MVQLIAITVKMFTLYAHDESATFGQKPNPSSIPQGRNSKSTIAKFYQNCNSAIQPQSLTFQGLRRHGNIERQMFPIILSWAVIVHKLLGTTVEKTVLYLGKKTFSKSQAYMALNRVKSLQGVAICQTKLFKVLMTNRH